MDIRAIEEEINKQCNNLPRREYASKALDHSFTVFARDMVEVSLLYLPITCLHGNSLKCMVWCLIHFKTEEKINRLMSAMPFSAASQKSEQNF